MKLAVALATVYLVWGSTYLAIAVADRTLPPMLMLSVRFLIAGGLLYAWSAWRGDLAAERPGRRQWRAAAIAGGLLLVVDTGGVAWAEQRVASGFAALHRRDRAALHGAARPRRLRRPAAAAARSPGSPPASLGVGLLVGAGREGRHGRRRCPPRSVVRVGGRLCLRARRSAAAATPPRRGDADAVRRRPARRRRHRHGRARRRVHLGAVSPASLGALAFLDRLRLAHGLHRVRLAAEERLDARCSRRTPT